MKPIDIPSHQDDPQWLIIWPIDELLPVMLCGCLGIIFSQVTILVLIGYGISRAYRVAKATKANGFVQHYMYSKGIYFSATKTLKNTFNRRYIPK